MTHSLSLTDADSPPAMYRSATFAIVVSRTSMNVGTTTAAATIQGLIAGRRVGVVDGNWAALVIRGPSCAADSVQFPGSSRRGRACRRLGRRGIGLRRRIPTGGGRIVGGGASRERPGGLQ